MTPEQLKELEKQFGAQASAKIKEESDAMEKRINEKNETLIKGLMKAEEFEAFKAGEIAALNKQLKTLEDAAKAQGDKMNELIENGKTPAKGKTLDDVIQAQVPELKKIQKAGTGLIEIDMKTAGITSIGNSIQAMTPPPNSPYLPGIGPGALELFGITYNPNFIMNFVDMGQTNQSRLAWLNETSVEGAAAAVQEGAAKPAWNTRFKVEMSIAKKIAALTTITEEFEDDLPGLGTAVRRLLQDEVMRKFDDALQTAIIAIATAQGYNITGLNFKVDDSNYWDGIFAGIIQIGVKNYIPNFIGINPVTLGLTMMTKAGGDRQYVMPPFLAMIQNKLRESNKVTAPNVLIGDITQYKVDMYKNLVLKLGFNNDDFGRNQFSVVAELRYHDYISDNRKPALTYYNLDTIVAQIDSGS